MHICYVRAGLSGNEGAALQWLVTIRAGPLIPNRCYSKRLAAWKVNPEWTFPTILRLPLVEAVSYGQAAPLAECIPEGRFRSDGLGPGIDQQWKIIGRVGPTGN